MSEITTAASRSVRPVHLSMLLALSLLMLFYAIIPHTSRRAPGQSIFGYDYENSQQRAIAEKNGSIIPALVGMRDTGGEFWVRDRVEHFWTYQVAHALPAVTWVTLMPLQHIVVLRTRYPKFHRFNGRAITIMTLVITISGLALPAMGLSYSHPNFFHVHRIKLGGPSGWTVFIGPTFSFQTTVLGLWVPVVTWRMYRSALKLRTDRQHLPVHKYWATVFTYLGYIVPINRVFITSYVLFGVMADKFLSHSTKIWLGIPQQEEQFHDAELAAQGWAVTMCLPVYLYLVWRLPVPVAVRIKPE